MRRNAYPFDTQGGSSLADKVQLLGPRGRRFEPHPWGVFSGYWAVSGTLSPTLLYVNTVSACMTTVCVNAFTPWFPWGCDSPASYRSWAGKWCLVTPGCYLA